MYLCSKDATDFPVSLNQWETFLRYIVSDTHNFFNLIFKIVREAAL